MRDSERIKVIEAILLRQTDFLYGCQFRVEVAGEESFKVTFEKMTNAQLQRLRAKLQEYSLEHIQVISKVIVDEQDPEKPKPPKKKNRKGRWRQRHKG